MDNHGRSNFECSQDELALFLREQHRAYDAGDLDSEARAYLDVHMPGWNGPEARWFVGTDFPPSLEFKVVGAWLVGLHRRYDAGQLSEWTQQRLEELMPGWNGREGRKLARRYAGS